MSARKILLALDQPHADPHGRPGVIRWRKDVWLTDDVRRGPAVMLDAYRPGGLGLPGDRRLEGGLLPLGAVSATVTDDAGVRRAATTGSGAWAIVLEGPYDGQPSSPVCFRDAADAVIASPLPADWARSMVADADKACPACDSVGKGGAAAVEGAPRWDEVVPTDESRGSAGPDIHPTPFVACRTCGHEHSVGSWLTAVWDVHDHDPEEQARLMAAARARMAEEIPGPLGNSSITPYAVPGRPPRLGGWGLHSSEGAASELTSITVDQGAVGETDGPLLCVQTSNEREEFDSDVSRARSMLAGSLREHAGPTPERSPAGLAVWWHIRERELLRLATLAQVEERSILVDREPTTFVVATSGSQWTAAGRVGDLQIAFWGRDCDIGTIELAVLADPVRDLLGD